MMHYANVVMEAKELGFESETAAKSFARKVISTAALLAMMPEDVLKVWRNSSSHSQGECLPVVETMSRLNVLVPEEIG